MVKHLKKVCKTIISMLIKFVGFDHIFPESEVFIMGNSLLKTERKKHLIVRPFPERDEELEDIFRTYDFELMVYFSNYITFRGTMEGEAEKLRKVLSYCKRSKEIHVIYLTGPEAGDAATTGKTLLVRGAENLCCQYGKMYQIPVKIVRIPYLYSGVYKEDYFYKMFAAIRSGEPVEIQDNALNLNWDVSYDFDAEDITYIVELATDYQFQNVIFRQEGVAVPEVQTSVPAAGQYFVRVRATDSSGKTQDAFDYYVTDNGKNYGMKCFYVTADQRIEEDIYEKIKNISHVGIAEHMKQLKNAEIPEPGKLVMEVKFTELLPQIIRDLLYLFWAITTGITAGAGMYVLAVLAAVIMIVMIYLFYHRQQSGKIYIVVIHYTGDDTGDEIIRNFGKIRYFIKSKTMRKEKTEMAVEVFCRQNQMDFTEKICKIENVDDVTLIQYNGEYHG